MVDPIVVKIVSKSKVSTENDTKSPLLVVIISESFLQLNIKISKIKNKYLNRFEIND